MDNTKYKSDFIPNFTSHSLPKLKKIKSHQQNHELVFKLYFIINIFLQIFMFVFLNVWSLFFLETLNFSLKTSPTLSRATSPLNHDPESGYKYWHLVR